MQALIIFAATVPALANVRDHLMPNYLPNPITCPGGCANWADAGADPVEQARLDGCWQNGTPPKDAANACAMPGGSAGRDLGDGIYIDLVVNSFAGPWCYCATPAPDSDAEQYCYPGPKTLNNPEQINLQMAKEDVIVVSFVTREESSAFGLDRYTADHQVPATLPAPSAEFVDLAKGGTTKTIPGISHYYKALSTAEHQDYVLHFIKFAGLTPNTKYKYRVKSGSNDAPFSEWLNFRSPNVAGPTKLAIYGDMGHSQYNNMENMLDDCNSGVIDFIVHMGDHAYDLGGASDRRGDAYMNVFQPTLSTCPWLPIIGNHESDDGDHFDRYLNMTWGEVEGKTKGGSSTKEPTFKSTADSVLVSSIDCHDVLFFYLLLIC